MIPLPKTILVAMAPVDMHLSFDRLAALVKSELQTDPKDDTLVVFFNRRRTLVKMLWYDGSGYVLLYKRLDRRLFRVPSAAPMGTKKVAVARKELLLML